MFAKLLLLCPTLWDLMNCTLPNSSVHDIIQATIMVLVAMPSSRGSFWPKDWTHNSYVSCISRQFFITSTIYFLSIWLLYIFNIYLPILKRSIGDLVSHPCLGQEEDLKMATPNFAIFWQKFSYFTEIPNILCYISLARIMSSLSFPQLLWFQNIVSGEMNF